MAFVLVIIICRHLSPSQDFLLRYLETGHSTLFGRRRVLFGAHRNGWLVPLEMTVRVLTTQPPNILFTL